MRLQFVCAILLTPVFVYLFLIADIVDWLGDHVYRKKRLIDSEPRDLAQRPTAISCYGYKQHDAELLAAAELEDEEEKNASHE